MRFSQYGNHLRNYQNFMVYGITQLSLLASVAMTLENVLYVAICGSFHVLITSFPH